MELNSNGIHFTLIYLSRHRTQIVRGFFSSYPTLITKQFCQKRKKAPTCSLFMFFPTSILNIQLNFSFLLRIWSWYPLTASDQEAFWLVSSHYERSCWLARVSFSADFFQEGRRCLEPVAQPSNFFVHGRFCFSFDEIDST